MISLLRTGRQTVQLIAVVLAVRVASTNAHSQTLASPSPGRAQGISYHVFGEAFRNEPKIHLVIFSSSQFSLRVIDNGTRASSPAYRDLPTAMRRYRCLAGINGGFFDPTNFTPAGLMVSDGRIISSFDAKGWQEGVLAVRNEAIELTDREAFALQPTILQGLQSSPWLIRSGRIEPAHKSDSRRASRAFVAAGEHDLWAIGTSTPATFQEVGQILLSDPLQSASRFGKRSPWTARRPLDSGPASTAPRSVIQSARLFGTLSESYPAVRIIKPFE
jgi:hypothetical protein